MKVNCRVKIEERRVKSGSDFTLHSLNQSINVNCRVKIEEILVKIEERRVKSGSDFFLHSLN